MFLEDEIKRKHNKVNLGSKILTKNDYIKKLENDEMKEKLNKKKEKSNEIIKKFLHKNFISSKNVNLNLPNNLNQVLNYLNSNKIEQNKIELIILKTFEKTNLEILNYLNCRLLNSNLIFNLISIIKKLFSFLSDFQIKNLFVLNQKIYIKILLRILSISCYEIYFKIKRDYLINDEMNFFNFLYYLLFVISNKEKNFIIKKLSLNNIYFIYALNFIVDNYNKILSAKALEILFIFLEKFTENILIQREKFKKLNYINYSNKIINDFLEKFLLFILNTEKKFNFLFLCLNLENYIEIFNKFSEKNLLNIFNNFLLEINDNNNNFISEKIFYEKDLIFFSNFFNFIKKLNLIKYYNDRTIIINALNKILTILFKNISNSNYSIKNIIYLIRNSAMLLESLYKSEEKSSLMSILEHIINKIAIKNIENLYEKILDFSADLLLEIFPNINPNLKDKIIISNIQNEKKTIEKNIKLFEIISFIVINKINYKSNYFFVEFKTTKNIKENLPFNYFYLNFLSKYLIILFTDLMSKTDLDKIEKFSENLIIKCLKSLYFLDKEINFTPNSEKFWNKSELISKTNGKNSLLIIEIMKIMPFIFPIQIRVKEGQKAIASIIERSNVNLANSNINNFYDDENLFFENTKKTQEITIPRESIFNTSFMYYMQNLLDPFKKWKISFVNRFGQREEGIDAGGLFKEYLIKLSEEAFGNNFNYFIESQSGFLLPNINAYRITNNNCKKTFEFLGFITGKAILEGIKIYPNFSSTFLNNVLGIENTFIDLKEFDFDLYKNLVNLKTYEGDVENDLCLSFCIDEDDGTGKIRMVNLIENGENIKVNNNNRFLYIKKVTEYKLTFQFKNLVEFFKEGIEQVIDMEILKIFSGDDLRQIIFGFEKDAFDVDDMRINIEYQHWNFEDKIDQQCIEDFFRILKEFSVKEKEKFLFFCTSLKRLPIGGFAKLRPKFVLSKAGIKIPTSSTCVNMLKLPVLPYKELKEKLLYVINADAGFYYA